MREFLNPKSMLSPGAAGGLMMLLVTGICTKFPEVPQRYLAVFFSLVIGAAVVFWPGREKLPVLQKAVYWILNSCVIFVVGFGAADLAAEATSGGNSEPKTSVTVAPPGGSGHEMGPGRTPVEASKRAFRRW